MKKKAIIYTRPSIDLTIPDPKPTLQNCVVIPLLKAPSVIYKMDLVCFLIKLNFFSWKLLVLYFQEIDQRDLLKNILTL